MAEIVPGRIKTIAEHMAKLSEETSRNNVALAFLGNMLLDRATDGMNFEANEVEAVGQILVVLNDSMQQLAKFNREAVEGLAKLGEVAA